MEWIKTKSDEAAIEQGCYFDLAAATRVRTFIETYCYGSLDEWAGKPIRLLEWQWQDIVAPLYGWRKADGTLRFSLASVWLPKCNGKTTLAGALATYELLGGRQGAHVVGLANTEQEAGTLYRSIVNGLVLSPLKQQIRRKGHCTEGHIWIRDNLNSIQYDTTNSTLKLYSGADVGRSGVPISFLVWDEVGALPAKRGTLWDTLLANVRKRRNSIMFAISHAWFDLEGVGHHQCNYARKILNGEVIDTSVLPVIYSAAEGEDWRELSTAQRANPNWGVSVYPERIQEALNQALTDPRAETAYKTLHLNCWVGSSVQWLPSDVVEKCYEDFDETTLYGKQCEVWGAVDLGITKSDTAVTYVVKKEDLYYVVSRYYVPEDLLRDRQESTGAPYLSYAKMGVVTATPGDYFSLASIRAAIKQDCERFNVVEFGFDPYAAQEIWQSLADDGANMIEVRQHPRYLAPATMFMENLIRTKRLRFNSPLLRWNISNAKVKADDCDNPVIEKKGYSKLIDGLSSCLTALRLAMVNEDQPPPFISVM